MVPQLSMDLQGSCIMKVQQDMTGACLPQEGSPLREDLVLDNCSLDLSTGAGSEEFFWMRKAGQTGKRRRMEFSCWSSFDGSGST